MNPHLLTEHSEFGRNVYVASLPVEFDDDQLFNLFAPYGPISSARVMRAKGTRQSKGYGFVLYKNANSAEIAISSLVGHVLEGNKIQVRLAHPDASVAYSGQRSSRSNSSTPGTHSLQATTPPLPPLIPQPGDPSMMVATYPSPALYPTMYQPVIPSPMPSAPSSAMPGVFPPPVMLVPQYASQMQQTTNQPTYYFVVPNGGSAIA